jgi:Sec-independent protein translocase protein TatA
MTNLIKERHSEPEVPGEERLALDPLELGTIAAILLVFFLWGPQKIPELARMIGQARKEFDNATREFQSVTQSLTDVNNPLFAPSKPTPQLSQQGGGAHQGTSSSVSSSSPTPALPLQPTVVRTPVKTGDQLLIEAARKLGIPTQGKTREQIQLDIISMAQQKEPQPLPRSQPEAAQPATVASLPKMPTKDDTAGQSSSTT